MKTACIMGGGGFIGSHLVRRLKKDGYWVRAVDLKYPEFSETHADEFIIGDLRDHKVVEQAIIANDQCRLHQLDELYQLAADMGGAGFIFTGDNDADVMHNSGLINMNVAKACVDIPVGRIFYSSSACIYPSFNQEDPENPNCAEDSAYPAFPDSEYGWEKLFSERIYRAFARNYGLSIRIARFHNICGPEGTWTGGREKAPAAMCRKVAEAEDGGNIEVWGKGDQTRSFLYIDECIEGILQLMHSNVTEVLNIGSEEMISINDLARMTIDISGKDLGIKNIDGPLGVMGRNSDNRLIQEHLGWQPDFSLRRAMELIYEWVEKQVHHA